MMIVDLTDFALDDSVLAAEDNADDGEKMDAVGALKYIDDHWYKKIAGKKARWMDLIGDYAGNERFILDGNHEPSAFVSSGGYFADAFVCSGESLLQHVLDDPLVALARTGGEFRLSHMRSESVSAFAIYRSEFSDSARCSLDGATLERDASEICRI